MLTSRYGSRTAWHGCTLMVWSNDSQDSPGIPCGPRKGIFNVFHILRDPNRARAGPAMAPYDTPLRTRKGIFATRIDKNPTWASYLAIRARTGPLRPPHGLFTGCLGYQNPYGARKLIMLALKLYGPRTGRQNSYGAARGPCGAREWT